MTLLSYQWSPPHVRLSAWPAANTSHAGVLSRPRTCPVRGLPASLACSVFTGQTETNVRWRPRDEKTRLRRAPTGSVEAFRLCLREIRGPVPPDDASGLQNTAPGRRAQTPSALDPGGDVGRS